MFDTNLAWFMSATLALNISPGPDVMYVLANSARHGTRGGVIAAIGISFGIALHACLAAAGAAALLLAHPWAFNALRVVGAAYLIALGIGALRSSATHREAIATFASAGQIFRRGLLTNVLNPKVALFFLAFLPQFADPDRGSVAVQVLAYGLLFIASGTAVNVGYAWVGGSLSAVLRRDARWQRRLNYFSGSVLILLGMRLLVSARTA
jgi:threonine/homoserine/homoserine lactone efflux protein